MREATFIASEGDLSLSAPGLPQEPEVSRKPSGKLRKKVYSITKTSFTKLSLTIWKYNRLKLAHLAKHHDDLGVVNVVLRHAFFNQRP
jgi:hypothetical protein